MWMIKKQRKHKNAVLIAVCMVAAFASALLPFNGKSVETSANISNLSAATNGQRISFLSSYGWECEEEPCEVVDVLIPTEFSGIYQKYEALQKNQGFSLEELRGTRVKRYSYKVLNPPAGCDSALAELLVKDGKVVAGAICRTDKDGEFEKIIT